MMDNGLPGTSYASLITFLAGAFVFQENTPLKISYASLITFLARAFVFQENTSLKISDASLITFLAGAFLFQDELVSSAARACVLKISTNVNLLCLVIISGMKRIQS